MGWLIALVVIVLIACFPIGVSVHYDEHGILVRVIAWIVRFTVFPFPKKKKVTDRSAKKQKKDEKTDEAVVTAPATQIRSEPVQKVKKVKDNPPKPTKPESTLPPPPKTKGGSLTDFLPFVNLGLDFLNDFRKKLRVDRLDLKLVLAGDDPCDLAVNYGRAWAALDSFLPVLERVFIIKKRDLEVECDFCTAEISVYAHLDLTITVGRVLSMGTLYGIRALKEYMKFRKNRKGGVTV